MADLARAARGERRSDTQLSAVQTGAPSVTPQMAPASCDLAIYAGDSYQWQFNL